MEKILVLNNDPDTMSLLKIWLEKKGYEVKFTGSKKEAVQLAGSFKPSLIIIDILQQGTLLAIKNTDEFKKVPVLLMTGHVSKHFNRILPVNDSIEKPFDMDLFEEKVRELLKSNVEA
jgi:DNA-binding response OmpR family regulator